MSIRRHRATLGRSFEELPFDVEPDEVRPRREQPAEDGAGPLEPLRVRVPQEHLAYPGETEAGPRQYRLRHTTERGEWNPALGEWDTQARAEFLRHPEADAVEDGLPRWGRDHPVDHRQEVPDPGFGERAAGAVQR